jgi:hypothetical protein
VLKLLGASANFTAGVAVTTGISSFSVNSTTLFNSLFQIANGGGGCNTRGWISGGTSGDDTFYNGVTNGGCSIATNHLGPNTWGIRAWVPGATPTIGPWQFSVDLAGDAAITGHLNQNATADFAGSCTMSAGTTCTFTLTAAYTSAPLGFAAAQVPATGVEGGCAVSGTTVTITASTSNSQTWNCLLIGNPN